MLNDLNSWLQYLNSLPSGLDLPLENFTKIKKFAEELNLNQFKAKVVTIAGTNGKGSCVAFLETILLHAGLKVAAFTSPHLLQYNERIRVNGKNIDDAKLCEAFKFIAEKCKINFKYEFDAPQLNFFAFTTLAAFYIFQQMQFDVILLEVGLGGQYDAVNIIDADIAIITTISLDHVAQLGNTREAIAKEKSGIMRANKPVICGDLNPPKNIFLQAKKIGAELFCLNKDFFYHCDNNFWMWKYQENAITNLPLPHLPMQNAATSLMAVKLLQDFFSICDAAIIYGVKNAFLLGRFQQMPNNIILDVAHNPESAELLASNLLKQKKTGKTIAIISMLKDKDIAGTIKPLLNIVDEWYIGILHNKRSASDKQFLTVFKDFFSREMILHLPIIYPSVLLALKSALKNKKSVDRIIIFGSFYTVSECLKFINHEYQS